MEAGKTGGEVTLQMDQGETRWWALPKAKAVHQEKRNKSEAEESEQAFRSSYQLRGRRGEQRSH